VPNDSLITHFNALFQTVNEADLTTGSGPSNVDARASGTSLSTFVRCADFTPIAPDLVQRELELRHVGQAREEQD
jgi:hypothetical protein